MVVCLCVVPWHAVAQSTPGTAQERFKEAAAELQAGNREAALDLFREAYRLEPRAKILINIATLYVELGRDAEAANAFARYLESADADAERLPRVKALLAELDERVGRVVIDIRVPDAKAQLDGEDLGSAPIEQTRRVAPGKHVVLVDAPDPKYRKAIAFEVNARETETVSLVFEAPKPKVVSMPTVEPSTAVRKAVTVEAKPAGKSLVQRGLERTRLWLRTEGALWSAEDAMGVRAIDASVVFAPGLSVTASEYLDVLALALVGGNAGFELGARGNWDLGLVRPTATLSLPVFVVDGMRAGVRGAAGAMWVSRYVRVGAEVGISYALSVPDDFVRTNYVGSLTMEVGL